MKLSSGINLLQSKSIEKNISKRILLANTSLGPDRKVLSKAVGVSNDPMYQTNDTSMQFNPDIRYKNEFYHEPLTDINYRNEMLLFAENHEISKAVTTLANELTILDSDLSKYPIYPKINETLVDEDKKHVCKAIQEYLDKVFYPKLWNYYNFGDEGFVDVVEEFLKTGKLAYEIVYDNLKRPQDIEGILPLDPASLQKVKQNGKIWYILKQVGDSKQRILHENQVVLIEWNKYDYGYVSYVDKLRIPYNIMKSMQTSKLLWFAAKSQVKIHVKLAYGDIAREDAIQKLTEGKNQYTNKFNFEDDGTITFMGKKTNSAYREFFTARTNQSGDPEIEEINSTGPDLTEVDSLQKWEKDFWQQTEIPYDRIDPSATDTWGFTDVTSLRKIEVNFGKFTSSIRKMLNPMFIKPIKIQLTLKEAEIGIDYSIMDLIKLNWVAFNEYEKLAELEITSKKIELASNIAQFGEMEDSEGNMRKSIPIPWIIKNYLDFTSEQLESMEIERKIQDAKLGFGGELDEEEEEDESDDEDLETNDEESDDDFTTEEDESDDEKNIVDFDDDNF